MLIVHGILLTHNIFMILLSLTKVECLNFYADILALQLEYYKITKEDRVNYNVYN